MGEAFCFLISVLFAAVCFVSPTTYKCNSTLACGCAKASAIVNARIVGGEAVSNRAWGWIVSLQAYRTHMCGATLISSQYAVTAAHCVEEFVDYPSILSILADTNSLISPMSSDSQRRTVTNIIIHPDYDKDQLTNDIAILQFFPLTISSNSSLTYICLPSINEDPFQINSDVVAIGWGFTYQDSGVQSNSLRQVTLQVYSSTSTSCINSKIRDINTQFCAGNIAGGKDTCQGDNGGPLMVFANDRWVLAGVTSYGLGCGLTGLLGIYTRVSTFIPFIYSNTGLSTATTTTNLISTSTNKPNSTDWNFGGNRSSILDKSILVYAFAFFLSVFLSSSYQK